MQTAPQNQEFRLPKSYAGHSQKPSVEAVDEKSIKQMIRTMNLKVTDQRMAILTCLFEGRAHMSAQEVFERVTVGHPDVGFATVYRFLRSLTEANLVTEVRVGGLPARYELNSHSHHDHLTCVSCGKICEFENRHIEELQEAVAKQFGFKLTSHVLELYGICSDCQKKQRPA